MSGMFCVELFVDLWCEFGVEWIVFEGFELVEVCILVE